MYRIQLFYPAPEIQKNATKLMKKIKHEILDIYFIK